MSWRRHRWYAAAFSVGFWAGAAFAFRYAIRVLRQVAELREVEAR